MKTLFPLSLPLHPCFPPLFPTPFTPLHPCFPPLFPTPVVQNIANHVAQRPELFPQVLRTLFEIVLFEDCSNQWSLSRPMLSLILVNESIYNELKMQIVASQPPERQAALAACLDKLMQDVQRNLDPKNRDKFTQSLTTVRHEFRNKVVS